MSDNFTSVELEELAQLERTLMKVKKAFGGRTVVIKGNSVEVSEPGSDIVMEYSLKDVLRRIHKKERGNADVNGRRATVRSNSRYSLATYGPSAARKRKTKTLRNTTRANADKAMATKAAMAAIAVKAMQDRLRALRRIEREKKKAERALAAGAAGAGSGAVHSPSLSRSRSSSGSNNVGELASMLNSMTVTEVKSEIAELEAALAKMGL